MKKKISVLLLIPVLLLAACGGGKKESAASIAQKWCDLNAKAHKAEGEAKEAAKKAVDQFENEMEAKYKNDEAFLKEVEREAEKCEDASEGR